VSPDEERADEESPNEEVVDSPTGWVAQHIRSYTESDGETGHIWRNVPTLLLTTRGRRTGKRRRTALIYGRDGDSYVVVASLGGSPRHPLWYLNLVADPRVELQVGAEKFAGTARTASEKEKPRLWQQMSEIWPDYPRYQQKTKRQIPVVIIDRS
jgi:deazaflavin-dependent oxidoreductase (nitroreductase family)